MKGLQPFIASCFTGSGFFDRLREAVESFLDMLGHIYNPVFPSGQYCRRVQWAQSGFWEWQTRRPWKISQ